MGSHAEGHVGHKHHFLLRRTTSLRLQRKSLCAGIALACGVLFSPVTLALELGDITLSSSLNEPLSAAIALERLDGVQAGDIAVTLGDDAAYRQAGIERDPVLDDIEFRVEVQDADRGRIVLSSARPVSEPFLNLIVSVAEPGGTQRKEYTLLLELANAAVTQSATPPAASQSASQSAAATVAGMAGGNAQTWTVGAGDTLWEIAMRTRPDSSVSVQQMMLAIQRANPDAFRNGNINALLSGRVLRIPSQQDIAVIDRQAAVAQVAQQNTALGGQPLATGNATAAGGGATARDQLRVLSGDTEPDTRSTGGAGADLAATIAELENQLALAEESLDRARLENLELNNRLAALQEQIDLLENIIAMEDDRIATLQAELVRQAEATAQALAAAENSAAALEQLNSQPTGIAGLLRNGVVMLGAAVAVMAGALLVLVQRRRQAQLDAEEKQFNPALADVDAADAIDDDVDDAGEDSATDAKPGLLAGLFARFRRNRDDEDEDYDDYEAEDLAADRAEPAAGAAAYAATQDSTDRLRGAMGMDDERGNLDGALDIEAAEAQAEVFEPLVDDEPAEAVAEQVAAEEEVRQADDDYAMTAADAALAAVDTAEDTAEEAVAEPAAADDAIGFEVAADAAEAAEPAAEAEPAETIEFTVPAESAPEPVAAVDDADDDDIAETFEFTLKDLPDIDSPVSVETTAEPIETFSFTPGTLASAPEPEPEAPKAGEELEVIAFPGTGSTPAAASAQGDDLPLELGDISFDDTTLIDDEEEESPFKPRTGNECDTKLDLATAYEAMGDVVEAIEILDEVIAEGSPSQVETAQRLKETWQASL